MKSRMDKKYEDEDEAWAEEIKKRDKTCVWCGSTTGLSADHIFSRKVLATRWLPTNGVALCVRCHIFRKQYEPMEWALVVLDRVGLDALHELRELHKTKKKEKK